MYSNETLSEIKEQVKKVLIHSQGIKDINIDGLMQQWITNKSVIRDKYFSDNPIYEFPEKVRFELDFEGKLNRLNCFKDYVCYRTNYLVSSDLEEYLDNIEVEEFFNNRLTRDYATDSGIKINAETKFVKSLKYFIDDKEALNDIQSLASNYIQENKVEGYLCLSIHPLDYLSSSETNFKWRSCHALDGEYRAGNLSYMADSSTIVCYLKSEEDTVLPRFPESVKWNNKKWRCLLHFNKDLTAVFAGRQYPFYSVNALDKIRNILICELKHSFLPENFSHWYNEYLDPQIFKYANCYENEIGSCVLNGKYFVCNHRIYDLWSIIKDGKDSLHYNDLLYSTVYKNPYFMFKKYQTDRDMKKFYIGEAVSCIKCGNHLIEKHQDSMLCEDCIKAEGDI